MNTKPTPALLTAATEAEVSAALLRHATLRAPGAVLVEHTEAVPPIAPESVTYRLGELEVEPLEGALEVVAGAAKISQRIDVWVPGQTFETGAGTAVSGAVHATLGEVEKVVREARLSDGTTVVTGTYSVNVLPRVPLIEGRSEETVREALDNPRRGRKVGKLGPVEGTPEHRHQVVEYSITTSGDVRQALHELRGTFTAAGVMADVGELKSWADKIGSGSFTSATPSTRRLITLAGVRLEWREA